MNYQFDVVAIGAGPGGYVAAIRAAQLGLKAAIIDKDSPGGVCLNWGCIPSKNLIHQADVFESAKSLQTMGITVDTSTLNYAAVQKQSRKVTQVLSNGVKYLLDKNKVEYIQGTAKVTGLYAIGDVVRSAALAHVASKEGEIAVEHMAGHTPSTKAVDSMLVPSAIYCEPQVAGFGLREDDAKRDGIAYKKSTFPYRGAGKSLAIGKPDGLVKILVAPSTNEILGGHIVGHNATELIHELLLAKHQRLCPDAVADMIHAHPTLSEVLMEALRGVNGQPIHV